MSASALVSGKLFRDPERKISKSGKAFVAATIKDGDGENATWWSVLAFSESAGDELMILKAGDAVAVSGGFKVELYERAGQHRLSFTIFVDRAISAKRPKREKAAERPKREAGAPPPRGAATFDDEIPF